MFYPNWFTESEQKNIRASSLWSVLQILHYNSGGKLFVSKWYPPYAIMSLINGLTVVRVETNSAGEIKVAPTLSITDVGCDSRQALVESSNTRYIAQKLSDQKGPGGKLLSLVSGRDANCMDYLLRPIVTDYVRVARKDTNHTTSINSAEQEWALKVIFGDVTKAEIPSGIFRSMQTSHTNMKRNETNQAKFATKLNDVFNKNKWLVGHMDESVIAGCINPKNYIQSAVDMVKNGYLSSNDPPEIIIPLRKYKSLPEVDPSIRDELMAALAFCKVNRETGGKRVVTADDQGLIPVGAYVYEDIGALAWRPTNNSQWFMCDKQIQ